MVAAHALKIPTAVFIYSWDNLPKGRMAVYADTYIVWSDHMKEELLGYYPDVREERVHVVGTPQFENYFNESLRVPRERFFADLGLDTGRPVVCFSGNDITSPFDPDFLEDLAFSLRAVAPERRPQILFRRSPVDTSDRFDGVLGRYPEIVVSNPLWQMVRDGDWSQLVPTEADGALLANVVYHSDIVINVGSTMGMDFAIFDKPAIYVNYNPAGKEHIWNIHEVYQLPHFASVHKLQPVFWANSPGELGELVMYALGHREVKKMEREAWVRLIVKPPLGRMAERFSEELRALASNGQSSPGSNR
jgi:hypothetical protein